MAFERETDVTKESVQDKEIVFFVPGADNTDGVQSGALNAQIKLSSGEMFTRKYNLLERLEDDAEGLIHKANLASLKDYLVARLDSEVLPL